MPKRRRVTAQLLSAENECDLPEEDSSELRTSPVAKRTRSATKVKQLTEKCHSEYLFWRDKLIARRIFMNSKAYVQYSYSLNPIDCSKNFVLKHSVSTANGITPDLVENGQSAKSHALRKSTIYRPLSYAITTCGELHIRKFLWDTVKSNSSIFIFRGSDGNISCTPALKKTLYIAPLSEKWTLGKIYFSVYFIEDMRSEKLGWKQKRCNLDSRHVYLAQPFTNQSFNDWEDLNDLENNIGQMLEKFVKRKCQVGRSNSKCSASKNSLDVNSNEQNPFVSKASNLTDLVPVINNTNVDIPQSPLHYLDAENPKPTNCNENEVDKTTNFDDSSSKLEKVVFESARIGNNYNNCDKNVVCNNVYLNSKDLEIEDTPQSLLDGTEYVLCLSNAKPSQAEEANYDLCGKNSCTNISNQLLNDSPLSGELSHFSAYSLQEYTLAQPAIVTSEEPRSSEYPLKEITNLSSANTEIRSVEIMEIPFPQVDNQTVLNLSSNNDAECPIWQNFQLEDFGYLSRLYRSYHEPFSTNYNDLVLYPDLQCYETLEAAPTKSDDVLWVSDYIVDPANDDPEKTSPVKYLNDSEERMQEVFLVPPEPNLNSFSNGDKGYGAKTSYNKHNDLACAALNKSVSISQLNLEITEVQLKNRNSNWLPSTPKTPRKIDVHPSSVPSIGNSVSRSTDSNGSDFSINSHVPSDNATIYVPIPQIPGFEHVVLEPYIPTKNVITAKSLSQQLKEFMESTKETNDSKIETIKPETKRKRATLKRKSTESNAGSPPKRPKVSRPARKKQARKAVTPNSMLSNTSVAVPVRQISNTVENNSSSFCSINSSSFDPFSLLKLEIAEKYKLGNQMVYVKDLLKISKSDLIAREVKMSDIMPYF